jgi:hypothetical protein
LVISRLTRDLTRSLFGCLLNVFLELLTGRPHLPELLDRVPAAAVCDPARRLDELETENTRLKKLLADSLLENEVTREALRRKW